MSAGLATCEPPPAMSGSGVGGVGSSVSGWRPLDSGKDVCIGRLEVTRSLGSLTTVLLGIEIGVLVVKEREKRGERKREREVVRENMLGKVPGCILCVQKI